MCSADSYFLDEDGVYKFRSDLISEAHASCLRGFAEVLAKMDNDSEGYPDTIVVDNTAIRSWEISPYYNLAHAYGHGVKIIHVTCDAETAYSRNIHGVPLERVEKMDKGLSSEKLPVFWSVEKVGNSGD